ncbi:MAG: phosphatidate cytidylyltransferase [Acidobacteriota bacterium]|nr:phosphatidate cytidylyltransferase [Acidobacteriota bacterium]
MVTRSTGLLLLVLLSLSGAGCAVIGGIFKAGVWVGGLGVILVLVIVAFAVIKMRR